MNLINTFVFTFFTITSLTSCGGSDSEPSKTNTSQEEQVEAIASYTVGNTVNFSPEKSPTMVVTIDFFNNVRESELSKISLISHISADDNPNYEGNEFAYFLEGNTSYYRWTFVGGNGGYCCTDNTDTYYEANNHLGHLQVKIYHYGKHTINTWSKLRDGTFHINVEANFYNDINLTSALSTDYFPGKDVFSTDGLTFIDNENDFVGNNNAADIKAINVEMSFE